MLVFASFYTVIHHSFFPSLYTRLKNGIYYVVGSGFCPSGCPSTLFAKAGYSGPHLHCLQRQGIVGPRSLVDRRVDS